VPTFAEICGRNGWPPHWSQLIRRIERDDLLPFSEDARDQMSQAHPPKAVGANFAPWRAFIAETENAIAGYTEAAFALGLAVGRRIEREQHGAEHREAQPTQHCPSERPTAHDEYTQRGPASAESDRAPYRAPTRLRAGDDGSPRGSRYAAPCTCGAQGPMESQKNSAGNSRADREAQTDQRVQDCGENAAMTSADHISRL